MVVVLAAGFQKQNPVGRITGQAIGQDAAGGPSTDNDVIVFSQIAHGLFFRLSWN